MSEIAARTLLKRLEDHGSWVPKDNKAAIIASTSSGSPGDQLSSITEWVPASKTEAFGSIMAKLLTFYRH
jgi:hypothetical protein